MARDRIERRACERFVIPGAFVYYRKEGLFSGRDFRKDICPVLDISRGGLCFVSQDALKLDAKLSLKITVPGEKDPLLITGRVCRNSPNIEKSYKYRVAVQFAPYSLQKGANAPELLERIIVLEEKFRGCATAVVSPEKGAGKNEPEKA